MSSSTFLMSASTIATVAVPDLRATGMIRLDST